MSVWYSLDACGRGVSVWKNVLESIFHRLQRRLENEGEISGPEKNRNMSRTEESHRDPASQVEMKEKVDR